MGAAAQVRPFRPRTPPPPAVPEPEQDPAADLAHELRHGLTTLSLLVRSLCSRWSHGQGESLGVDLVHLEQEVRHLSGLVSDAELLAAGWVPRDRPALEPVDLGAVVTETVERFAVLSWRSRRLEVLPRIAPGLPPAWADPQRLQQVLRNLLINALRHTPPGGLIVVEADRLEDDPRENLVVRVRDTGEGIPASELGRIWERGHRNPSGEGGLAGLGLSIVRDLVESMGGQVSAASKVGEGSCFTIELPPSRA